MKRSSLESGKNVWRRVEWMLRMEFKQAPGAGQYQRTPAEFALTRENLLTENLETVRLLPDKRMGEGHLKPGRRQLWIYSKARGTPGTDYIFRALAR